MRQNVFWLNYILMLIAQLILTNYLRVSPYLMLSVLPVMVLCIPIRVGTIGAMFIALITGLTVDLLTEGLMGLNTIALVPVAYLRNYTLQLIFGTELFARSEDFSIQRHGLGKSCLALFFAQVVFMAVYVWVDAAGMRPLSFNALRFAVSLGAGMLVSLPILALLAPDPRR